MKKTMEAEQKSKRIQEFRRNLQINDTEYLLKIWKENDHDKWTPEAFEAIQEILIERLGTIPVQ